MSGLACALVFTVACGQTDAGITSTVKSKLAADDTVKAYQVNVDTHDHVVTLSGTVDSALARERAVVLARETNGVRDGREQHPHQRRGGDVGQSRRRRYRRRQDS